MAATMSALLLVRRRAVIANVGDCRGYLFRDGALTQVTTDHSLVAEQVRLGLIEPEAARTHPLRNVVTRALSGEDRLAIDIVEFDVRTDDTFLLCSDGLSSMVADEDIRQCLEDSLPDAARACSRLIQLANQEGGKDNITVLVVSVPNADR
jgi:protein phosphatase